MPSSMPFMMTTSLMGPNLPSSCFFLAPPMILPLPAGVAKPPPSESGRFFCFSTLTCNGLTMPEPVAPSPEPLVQPYLANSRSANPCCPGRSDRSPSPSGWSSTGCSFAKASSSSASEAGISSGGGGRVYRTGARDIVAAAGCSVSRVRFGGADSAGAGPADICIRRK